VLSNENFQNDTQLKSAYIPQGVWMAVLDDSKLESNPEHATIAWYCNNEFSGPWPNTNDPNMYQNGPKLCKVMSLEQLSQETGIVPFPSLPQEVTRQKPHSQSWFIRDTF